MVARDTAGRLVPEIVTFDVFGTLIDVRAGSYAAFQSKPGLPVEGAATVWPRS